MGSLFPALPDELGWECLLRVELNSLHNISSVCKSWNAALKSPQFYPERRRLKISEQRVCIVQNIDGRETAAVYDPKKNSCKSLPPFPTQIPCKYHCHYAKRKLVLIADKVSDHRGNHVWLFDFSCSKWHQGTTMPTRRIKFASAADEQGGLIYVGGGYSRSSVLLRSALVYNVEVDKWDSLPDMNNYTGSLRGVFAYGKFYIMDWLSVLVFDSYSRCWKTIMNAFNGIYETVDQLNCMPFASAFGRLHCFSFKKLIEYDHNQNKPNIVATLPSAIWGLVITLAVGLGNKIFVSTSGLIRKEGFYMLALPSEEGGEIECIGLERPSGLQGSVEDAAILEL